MAHVSHKLSSSLQGALAGGGDPATSPLYVFGPFLRLIVVAGVAPITFAAGIWLVVFAVATASAMYRLVMIRVVDGDVIIMSTHGHAGVIDKSEERQVGASET